MDAGPPAQIATTRRGIRDGAVAGPNPGAIRAALVHDWLTGMRGGEKCLEVLCRAFPEAPLFTLIHRRGAMSPAIEGMDIRTSPLQRIPGALNHYRHLLPLMPAAARSWKPGPVDVVVSLSHCVAKSVRVPGGVPHICYCFTPMRYAWDGRSAYLDGWAGKPVRRSLAGATLDRLRAWDRASAAGVTQFVAISETVRRRIARCYGRESRVIPPPVDTHFYTPDPTTLRDGPYLCVSALVPYKKLEDAVIACSASDRPLIMIGSGPEKAKLERLAGPSVSFLGWQPDEVIRDHYRTCRALLFPGEEDFGIVPAEALACGAPVIALNRGGVAETVDDRVGWRYDEPGSDGLRRAIDAFEAAGRPYDPLLARRKAEALSPEVFRTRMLALIEDVLADRPAIPAPHVPIVAPGQRSKARRVVG